MGFASSRSLPYMPGQLAVACAWHGPPGVLRLLTAQNVVTQAAMGPGTSVQA